MITDSSTPWKTQNERVLRSWGLSAGAPSRLCSLVWKLLKFLLPWKLFSRSLSYGPLNQETPGAMHGLFLGLVCKPQLMSYCASRCTWGPNRYKYIYIHNIFFCFSLCTVPLFLLFKIRKQCHKKNFLPKKYCDW